MKIRDHGGSHAADPKRRGKKVLLIVGIVLAVIAAAVAIYAIWERPPAIPDTPGPSAPPPTSTVRPSAKPGDPTPSLPPDDDPVEDYTNALVTDRAPGTYTALLVGRDYASNSTDTIIVVRMDTKAHTIDFVSLPRDTLINISWSGSPKKLNSVYPGYINSGKNGIDGLKEHVKNLLGFDVDCYVVVSIQAVERAVDTIGGVWFDVPTDMHYWDPTQNLTINIDAGYQLLNGEDAVKVCRFRDTYAGGDIERIGVQQDFLRALASQILTLGNIPNLPTLIDILVENVETDLTAANIAWFARQFLACGMDGISFQTMPWSNGCLINGVSFVSVGLNDWLAMINERLNPYVEPVTAANVNILMSDYSGINISSTTGVISGGPDSFFCLPCTVANEGKSVHHLPGTCPQG